jgi:hypothetical protein
MQSSAKAVRTTNELRGKMTIVLHDVLSPPGESTGFFSATIS